MCSMLVVLGISAMGNTVAVSEYEWQDNAIVCPGKEYPCKNKLDSYIYVV